MGLVQPKNAVAWPVIVTKKDPMPGYEERDGEKDKRAKYFSENPGAGG
jgi:ferredoxin